MLFFFQSQKLDHVECWSRRGALVSLSFLLMLKRFYKNTNGSQQACSQDLEKGGLFWESEKCANDLDSNFHGSWISFRRFVRKLRRNVSESSEIQRFFPPKIRWSPKKKVFAKIQNDFSSHFANLDVWGGLFSHGGAIFHFSQKIGLKSTKNMRFCILHKPMGGLEPPPPPLATLLVVRVYLLNHRYVYLLNHRYVLSIVTPLILLKNFYSFVRHCQWLLVDHILVAVWV